MLQYFLLFLSLSVALLAFFLCIYAHRRVTKMQEATKDLDWSVLATLTGDLGTVKKNIQTLNNRLNGMSTATSRQADEEVLRYLANQKVATQANSNGIIGG